MYVIKRIMKRKFAKTMDMKRNYGKSETEKFWNGFPGGLMLS